MGRHTFKRKAPFAIVSFKRGTCLHNKLPLQRWGTFQWPYPVISPSPLLFSSSKVFFSPKVAMPNYLCCSTSNNVNKEAFVLWNDVTNNRHHLWPHVGAWQERVYTYMLQGLEQLCIQLGVWGFQEPTAQDVCITYCSLGWYVPLQQ